MWIGLLFWIQAWAGPWVHAPGEGYSRVGYRYYASQEGFTDGEATGMQYSSHSGTLYTEWGLPAGFQVIADLPFVAAKQAAPNGISYHHFWSGDLRLELNWEALKQAKGTIGVDVRVPTYRRPIQYAKAQGLTDEQLPFIADRFPALGDPCVDVTLKWMMGHGFDWGWIGGSIGPRFRTNFFRHQAWASIQSGVWIWPEHMALGLYAEGALVIPIGNFFYPSREWVYVQAQWTVAEPKTLPGWALELGVGGVPVARDTSKGIDFTVGLSYRNSKKKEQ